MSIYNGKNSDTHNNTKTPIKAVESLKATVPQSSSKVHVNHQKCKIQQALIQLEERAQEVPNSMSGSIAQNLAKAQNDLIDLNAQEPRKKQRNGRYQQQGGSPPMPGAETKAQRALASLNPEHSELIASQKLVNGVIITRYEDSGAALSSFARGSLYRAGHGIRTRPREITLSKHSAGESAMWKAVIMQAVLDCVSKSKRTEDILAREQALRWFTPENHSLKIICEFIGLDITWVCTKVKYALKNPEKWRRSCDL